MPSILRSFRVASRVSLLRGEPHLRLSASKTYGAGFQYKGTGYPANALLGFSPHLHPEWIVSPIVREIVEHRLKVDDASQPLQPAAILYRVEAENARRLITEALAEERPIPKPEQQLIEIVTRLRNQSIDREVAALNQTLGQPEISPGETNTVLQELNALRIAKRGPLVPLSIADAAV